MTHTPGPWHKDGGMILQIHEKPTGGFNKKLLAHVVSGDNANGYTAPAIQEALANARLIAAAPELLEALRNLRHLFDIGAIKIGEAVIPNEIATKAFAAITKATEN